MNRPLLRQGLQNIRFHNRLLNLRLHSCESAAMSDLQRQLDMRCNICGGASFSDMPKRPQVRCTTCGSLERTRAVALHIDRLALPPKPAILHFAPELGLSKKLSAIDGVSYRAADIDPARFKAFGLDIDIDRFDLGTDIFDLPENSYDLIVHNHVLEHPEYNYTVILLKLAKALTDEGVMLFTVPILPGHFSDELIKLSHEEKVARFGPMIHVRRFGRDFLQETLGMIFRVSETYDLTGRFPEDALRQANIPEHHWRNYTGASVFEVRKSDLRV